MVGVSGIPVTCRTRPCMRPRRSSHIIDMLGRGVSLRSTAVHHIVKSGMERIGISQPGISGMFGRSQLMPTPRSAIHRQTQASLGLWTRLGDLVSEGAT
jgi:hypothetical protein